jgi:hypothetical protein
MEANVATGSLMKTDDLEVLLERLDRLRPDARPAWGTLDAPRMLCHLGDQMRVALGELPAAPRHSWLTRTLLRFLVVHTGFQPPRGKVQTAPEMLASRPARWEADLDACRQLAARVSSGAASAVHPTFGPLTPKEWAKLTWKHMSYHLQQFGV